MKFLYISDTHITARTPSSRLDDIQDTIKMKFKELGLVIAKEGITAVVHGGDMFHRPEVSNKFVGEIAEIIRGWGIPMYVVPGNHDLQGQNDESLPHSKLGLLISTGVIKILNRDNPVVFKDGNSSISFEGQEYHPNIDKDPNKDYMTYNQTANYKVLVPHSMMLKDPFFDGTTYTLTKDITTGADLVLGAHYHPGFKTHTVGKTTFASPGSMLRVEASTHSINTKPKVFILDYDDAKQSMDIIDYELQVAKDGKDVFSQVNLEKKQHNTSLENFNAKLRSVKLSDVNILSMIDEYVKTNPEDVSIVQKAKDEIVKVQREQVVDNGFVPSKDTVDIDKVEIKNFQTHMSRTIDFVHGLNTLVGESNAGKTAILRAIYWCLYDKPTGSAFITTGKKSCSVKIHLSNGYKIERKRSKSASGSYILTKPDGTETEYKGFANNVPIDIINAHQMPEVVIAGKKYRLNISSQLEGAFMVTASSNDKMAMIGALVDADRADSAKKAVNAEKRNLSASYKKIEELRDKEVDKLAKYGHLDKMKVSVEMLELADSKLDSDEIALEELKDLERVHQSVSSNVVFVNNALSNMVIVDKNDIDTYKELLSDLENYSDLQTLHQGNTFKLSQIEHNLSLLGSTVDSKDIEEYSKLLSELEELQNLKASHEQFTQLIDNLTEKEKDYQKMVSQEDIEEYKRLIEEQVILLDLEFDYKVDSKKTFDFPYDLDGLKTTRDEYVVLMKEVIELTTLSNELAVIEPKIDSIDKAVTNLDKSMAELTKAKQDKIVELHGQVQICETCGSEVTADKLIEGAC